MSKVTKENIFTPITIVLESQEEVDAIAAVLGRVSGSYTESSRKLTERLYRQLVTYRASDRNVEGKIHFTDVLGE